MNDQSLLLNAKSFTLHSDFPEVILRFWGMDCLVRRLLQIL